MSLAYVETFAEIVADVLLGTFPTSYTPRAKRAVNNRYAHVWGLEDWTWEYAIANPTTSASSATLSVPADFGVPVGIWDDQGNPIRYVSPDDYEAAYLTNGSGTPESFTVVNRSVLLGPTPSSGATWTMWYRKRLTLMSEDADQPAIPVEFRSILVHGGRAELLAAYNDPTAGDQEQQYQLDMDAMRREYLIDAEGVSMRWGSDPTWQGYPAIGGIW